MKITQLNILQASLFFHLISLDTVIAKNLRSSIPTITTFDDDEYKARQLDWNFIGKMFNDDEFFSDYDKKEIPSSVRYVTA